MLWFFERDQHSVRLETRYDYDTAEYVAVATYPDGREETVCDSQTLSRFGNGSRHGSGHSRVNTGSGADRHSSFPRAGHTDGRSNKDITAVTRSWSG
jgi:hypothetical protein